MNWQHVMHMVIMLSIGHALVMRITVHSFIMYVNVCSLGVHTVLMHPGSPGTEDSFDLGVCVPACACVRVCIEF